MKLFSAFVIFALLLCGCGDQNQMDQAMAFRQKLTAGNGCSFTCTVTADYLDKVYTFVMECGFDNAGNMEFSVIEPDSISGITGKIDQTGGKLTFDEQALAFELLADGYVTPVSSPWLFIKSMRGGYISACGQEDDLLRVTLHDSYAEDALQLDVWLDAGNTPVRCEIVWQGRRILSLDVSSFSYL